MSTALQGALALQAFTVALLRWRLGRGWLTRPMVLLIMTGIVYNGVSEAVLAIPSVRAWDGYRLGISQQFISEAALIVSAGLLGLAGFYLLTRPERVAMAGPSGKRVLSHVLDWRFLALLCGPLAVITYQGRGYAAVVAGSPAASNNLASSFLIILVVLASVAFLERCGSTWFVAVLVVQSVLLAATGERLPLVTASVMLVTLLTRVHIKPSGQQLATALLLSVVGILGITGYRAVAGRDLYYQNSGLAARVEALGSGLDALLHTSAAGDTKPGLITAAAIRLDGNAFAGGVLQGMQSERVRLGPALAADSLMLVVPSSLWQSKLAHPAALNPSQSSLNQFGLPRINYLPTLPGLYLGFIGPVGVIAFLSALGFAWGLAERWLLSRMTAVRIVLLASLIQAVFSYEAGFPSMLITLRSGILLAVLAKTIELVQGRSHQVRPWPGGPVSAPQSSLQPPSSRLRPRWIRR